MEDTQFEPGLLQVFRLFMVVQIGLLLMRTVTLNVHTQTLVRPVEARILVLIASALLLGYLSWGHLQRKLGDLYLPLALSVASSVPILAQYLAFRNQSGLNPVEYEDYAWQQMLLLVFPLLLTSWQYRFRWVVLFTLGTGLADLTLTTLTVSRGELSSSHFARVVFMRTLAFLAIGYIVTRLMKAQREQRQTLQEANVRLARYAATQEQLTISRERNRLAHELHDTLAHTLSGIAVQLEAVKSLWDEHSQEARALLEQSLNATRSGLTETRRALKALRASPLEDLGLSLALRSLAETSAERSGLRLELNIQENLNDLPPGLEQGIYRVAQEALENSARHARACRVRVELVKDDESLSLTIADDGRGFDPYAVDAETHFGLQGMRERAEALGGRLEVESRPGEGSTVRLRVMLCQFES